jgi:hypothetical protein
MSRPSVFIGSSSEGLDFARAVRYVLRNDIEPTLWDEGFFAPGQTFVEELINSLTRFDFAILVLTPDDFIRSRSGKSFGPRDNVIFEHGLLMGHLGKERTFVVHQAGTKLKIPSDLAGLIFATYDWPRADNDHQSAVGPACDSIRKVIRAMGFSEAKANKQLQEVKEQVSRQDQKIEEQQNIINELVVFSMSQPIFKHLRDFHYNQVNGGIEYLFDNTHDFKRDLTYLRDHGFIESKDPGQYLNIDALYQGQNLSDVMKLTPAGEFYVNMREKYEKGLARHQ